MKGNGQTENINFKLSLGKEADARKKCNLRPLNLDLILKWLDTLKYEKRILDELKKMVKKYPHQALESFQKNIAVHVEKAAKKVKKMPVIQTIQELGEEEIEEISSPIHDPFDEEGLG